MTLNSLAPGFVTISYTGYSSRPHLMTLPVQPFGSVTPGVEPSLTLNNDTEYDLSLAVDPFIAVIKPQFASGTEFGTVTYWSKPTPSSDPVWIYEYTAGIVGTNAGTNVSMAQKVLITRTDAGGIHRLYLMECVATPNLKDVPPFATGNQNIFTFLTGVAGFVRGRDGGKLVSGMAVWQKTNDALRRKYFTLE
jgi:hypothetical protein